MARIFLAWLSLALFFAPSPAGAQAAAEPVALVRSFYAPNFSNNDMPLSLRLAALYRAASDNSRKHNAPVTGLDFSWPLNAQDTEPGFEKSLRFSERQRSDTVATIAVNFRNGREEELHYTLKRESGRWVVDDIDYVKDQPTTLSKMLAIGAKEIP